MIDKNIQSALAQKVNRAWERYVDRLKQLDSESLIRQAKNIALTEACKDELAGGNCSQEVAEYLLRFQDPLEVASDQMRDSALADISTEFNHILWVVMDMGEAEQSYPLDPMCDLCKKGIVFRPASTDEAGLFYALPPEKDAELGAIGHVRMDFGRSGKEFWHTWWDRGKPEWNSLAFRADLEQVMGVLRQGILKDLSSMDHLSRELGTPLDEGDWGIALETEQYRYCLRCIPRQGDYNAYLTCYDKQAQEQSQEASSCVFPGGWHKGDICHMVTNKAKRYTQPYTVESFDGTYFGVRSRTGLFHHASQERMFRSHEEAVFSLKVVGRLRFANGDVREFTDPDEYVATFKKELDYKATTGMTHETLTDDPEVRKAIDDAIYGLYGEDNPQPLADYEQTPKMEMGGM